MQPTLGSSALLPAPSAPPWRCSARPPEHQLLHFAEPRKVGQAQALARLHLKALQPSTRSGCQSVLCTTHGARHRTWMPPGPHQADAICPQCGVWAAAPACPCLTCTANVVHRPRNLQAMLAENALPPVCSTRPHQQVGQRTPRCMNHCQSLTPADPAQPQGGPCPRSVMPRDMTSSSRGAPGKQTRKQPGAHTSGGSAAPALLLELGSNGLVVQAGGPVRAPAMRTSQRTRCVRCSMYRFGQQRTHGASLRRTPASA